MLGLSTTLKQKPCPIRTLANCVREENNAMDMQFFVVLTTNMKKSPKHELGAGSAGVSSRQRTLLVKSTASKVSILLNFPPPA